MMLATLMRTYKLPLKTSKITNYKEYHQRNGDFILAAVKD
jgi:hypothetical protein